MHTLIVDDVRGCVSNPLTLALFNYCGIECFSLSNAIADTYAIYSEKKLSQEQLVHVQDFAAGFIEAFRTLA